MSGAQLVRDALQRAAGPNTGRHSRLAWMDHTVLALGKLADERPELRGHLSELAGFVGELRLSYERRQLDDATLCAELVLVRQQVPRT